MAYAGTASWDGEARRRRAVSLTAAVIVHLLLLLMLLRLTPPFSPKKEEPRTAVVMMPGEQKPGKAAHRGGALKKNVPALATSTGQKSSPRQAAPQVAEAQPWVLNPDIAGFNLPMQVTPVPPKPAPIKAPEQSAESGTPDQDGGPGSYRRVDWFRLPSDAEIDPYLPHKSLPANSWGEILCRTAPRWHVEDCKEYGQFPAGSGISRAMREASFQFLVMPPKINGKFQVGSPVIVHFDLTMLKDN